MKIITITLEDGDLDGRMECKIGGVWNGTAYKFPRNRLNEYKQNPALKQSGIYFLFGKNSDGCETVYIGKADIRDSGGAILTRIQEHEHDKYQDFWTDVVAFTASDNYLMATELSYLEHKFIDIVYTSNPDYLKNSNRPGKGNITPAKATELDYYIEHAKLVLSVTGHCIFDPQRTSNNNLHHSCFYIINKQDENKKATGQNIGSSFIVFEGSFVNMTTSSTLNSGYKRLRDENKIKINPDGILKQDILFSSPSAAASFILGRTANGNIEWKTVDGKLLGEYNN